MFSIQTSDTGQSKANILESTYKFSWHDSEECITLKIEAIRSSETLAHVRITWRYTPEDSNFCLYMFHPILAILIRLSQYSKETSCMKYKMSEKQELYVE
jgi:hypothetical protein